MTGKLNPEYWGKTAAGILPLCIRTGRVLLILRSQFVYEPWTWGIPGGRVEDGSLKRDRETGKLFRERIETPEAGAIREFREETGYKGRVVLLPLYVFQDVSHGFAFFNFLGLVNKEFSEARVEQCWEVEIARWMTISEALEIEPKHFGLRALFAHEESLRTIIRYVPNKTM